MDKSIANPTISPADQCSASSATTPPWNASYAGDQCVVLEFGQVIDKILVNSVVAMNARISAAMLSGQLTGLLETVPTFRSLALIYDPLLVHPDELIEQIRTLQPDVASTGSATTRRFNIPVHYGGEFGPDLHNVARLTGLEEQEVVALHAQTEFTVYMLGFLPGFAFLGDTPAALHLPRLSEPRVRVPAGSVAIAMQLTGIYPWDSPGGWHILGNCPVPLFNGTLEPPVLFQAGDTVCFKPIDLDEYQELTDLNEQGRFERSSLSNNPQSAYFD